MKVCVCVCACVCVCVCVCVCTCVLRMSTLKVLMSKPHVVFSYSIGFDVAKTGDARIGFVGRTIV